MTSAPECSSGASIPEFSPHDYGSLKGFYDIGYHMSMGLVPKLSDDTLNKIGSFINGAGSSDVGNMVDDVVKSSAGPIVLLSLGVLILFVDLLLFFILICARCCCRSCGATRYQSKYGSKWPLYIGTITTLIGFAFVMTGTIIYGISVNKSYDVLKTTAWNDIDSLIDDADKVLNTTADGITCAVEVYVGRTFYDTNNAVGEIPNTTFSYFNEKSGLNYLSKSRDKEFGAAKADMANATIALNALQDVKTDKAEIQQARAMLQSITYDALQTTMQTLITQAQKVLPVIQDAEKGVNTKLSGPIADTQKQLGTAEDDVLSTAKDLRKAIDDIQKSVKDVEKSIKEVSKDIHDFSGLNGVRIGVLLLGVIPCTIILVGSFIIFFGGAVRSAKASTPPHHRSPLSHSTGYCAMISMYLTLLFGAIIMGIAVATFFGGMMVSAVCKPIFKDSDYRLFNTVDEFSFKVQTFSGSTRNVKMGDVLKSCGGSTMFTVMGGDAILNENEIMSKIDFDKYSADAQKALDNYQIQGLVGFDTNSVQKYQADYKAFSDNTEVFRGQTAFLPNTLNANPANQQVQDAVKAMKAAQSSLINVFNIATQFGKSIETFNGIAKNGTNQLLKEGVAASFDNVHDATKGGVNAFMHSLKYEVASCTPLLTTFNNVGVLVCDHIAMPVHGTWAAIGLAALFCLPLAIAALLVSKFLFSMDSHYYKDSDPDSAWEQRRGVSGSVSGRAYPQDNWAVNYDRDYPMGSDVNLIVPQTTGQPIIDPYPMSTVYPALPNAFEEYEGVERNRNDSRNTGTYSRSGAGLKRY